MNRNIFYSVLNRIVELLVSIIIFGYVSRILGVDNIGKYTYSSTVITYFLLLSEFGIEAYATREGSKLRKDKSKLCIFLRNILFINLISMMIAYFSFLICIVCGLIDRSYSILMSVLSVQMLSKMASAEWYFSAMEKFKYIACRGIVTRAIELVVTIMFVKQDKDLILFAGIIVGTESLNSIANIVYLIYEYGNSLVGRLLSFKENAVHVYELIKVFCCSILISVYSMIDVVMLNRISGPYEVGLYSATTKITSPLSSLLGVAVMTLYPKISYEYMNDKGEYVKKVKELWTMIMTVAIPINFGIVFLRKDVLRLLYGVAFLDAENTLVIMAFVLSVSGANWFVQRCFVLAQNREKVLIFSAMCSIVLNLSLNFLFIPLFGRQAAAVSTLISEMVVFLVCCACVPDSFKVMDFWTLIKIIIGCIPIFIISLIEFIIPIQWYFHVLLFFVSIVAYVFIEYWIQNEIIFMMIKRIRNRKFLYGKI